MNGVIEYIVGSIKMQQLHIFMTDNLLLVYLNIDIHLALSQYRSEQIVAFYDLLGSIFLTWLFTFLFESIDEGDAINAYYLYNLVQHSIEPHITGFTRPAPMAI